MNSIRQISLTTEGIPLDVLTEHFRDLTWNPNEPELHVLPWITCLTAESNDLILPISDAEVEHAIWVTKDTAPGH